jgi:hypothetical protein
VDFQDQLVYLNLNLNLNLTRIFNSWVSPPMMM